MTSSIGASSAIPDIFIFGASREMAIVAATWAQIARKSAPSTSGSGTHNLRACYNGPVDQIGQA